MSRKKKPAQREEIENVNFPDSYGSANRGPGRSPQIRHTRPEVAAHVARLVVGCNMDFEAAVSKMWAEEYPDATELQIQEKAQLLQESPHVRRAIEAQLEKIGFGDKAQARLIALLWKEVLGTNDKRWVGAARLLAEITQASKANQHNEKIPVLRVAGMEEGVKAMLGDSAPTDDYATIDLEDEDDAPESDDDATGFKSTRISSSTD